MWSPLLPNFNQNWNCYHKLHLTAQYQISWKSLQWFSIYFMHMERCSELEQALSRVANMPSSQHVCARTHANTHVCMHTHTRTQAQVVAQQQYRSLRLITHIWYGQVFKPLKGVGILMYSQACEICHQWQPTYILLDGKAHTYSAIS
jgi:hypothetical protein